MKLLTEKFVLTMVRSLVISKPKSKSEIVAISTSTILMKRSFVVSDTVPDKVNDIKVNFTLLFTGLTLLTTDYGHPMKA